MDSTRIAEKPVYIKLHDTQIKMIVKEHNQIENELKGLECKTL